MHRQFYVSTKPFRQTRGLNNHGWRPLKCDSDRLHRPVSKSDVRFHVSTYDYPIIMSSLPRTRDPYSF